MPPSEAASLIQALIDALNNGGLTISLKEHFETELRRILVLQEEDHKDIRSLRDSRSEAIGRASQASWVAWIAVILALVNLGMKLFVK